MNRLASRYQYHASEEPDAERLLAENIELFTKCSNICRILQEQLKAKNNGRVKYISSHDAPIDENVLNELEEVIQLMQQKNPHQVEFQNEADFEARTLNIERLLELAHLTFNQMLLRMNEPPEPPKAASNE